PFWCTCSSRALKLRQSEGTVKIALSFCTSSAYMGDLTSFLAVVVCVRSPFFRVKWLILPGQPVTPRKRYSISLPGLSQGNRGANLSTSSRFSLRPYRLAPFVWAPVFASPVHFSHVVAARYDAGGPEHGTASAIRQRAAEERSAGG